MRLKISRCYTHSSIYDSYFYFDYNKCYRYTRFFLYELIEIYFKNKYLICG